MSCRIFTRGSAILYKKLLTAPDGTRIPLRDG